MPRMPVEKKTTQSASARQRAQIAPEPAWSEEPVPATPAPEPVIKPEETFTFRATHVYAVLVVLAFAVGILVGYVAWGRTAQSALVPPQAAAPAAGAVPTGT